MHDYVHRLLCLINSPRRDFMRKLCQFHTKMISAWFLTGSVLLGGKLQEDAQKFWNFWKPPLYEMWEYALKLLVFGGFLLLSTNNILNTYKSTDLAVIVWDCNLKEPTLILLDFFSKLLQFWYHKDCYIFLIIILKFHAVIPQKRAYFIHYGGNHYK